MSIPCKGVFWENFVRKKSNKGFELKILCGSKFVFLNLVLVKKKEKIEEEKEKNVKKKIEKKKERKKRNINS